MLESNGYPVRRLDHSRLTVELENRDDVDALSWPPPIAVWARLSNPTTQPGRTLGLSRVRSTSPGCGFGPNEVALPGIRMPAVAAA